MEPQTNTIRYDYEMCDGEMALKSVLWQINLCGYDLIAVTQYKRTYTVFFRRPLNG